MPLLAGARLGPYEIVSLLGMGGMGEVYLAHDTKLDRDVALKLLPAELASDSKRLRRFELEARAASALNHPAIVAIYDLGQAANVVVLAGSAYAFRAPITAYLGSLGGNSTKPADSVQLAPIPQDIQLNDKPLANQPPGSVVMTSPSAVAPQTQQPPNVAAMMKKAVTAQATRPGAGTVRQPDAPPPNLPTAVAAFPGDFRPPEAAPTSRAPAATSASGGEAVAVSTREAPPARAAAKRCARRPGRRSSKTSAGT